MGQIMKSILFNHLVVFLIIAGLFTGLGLVSVFLYHPEKAESNPEMTKWLQDSTINWQDPLHQALIADVLDLKSVEQDGEAFVRSAARLKSDETAKTLEQLRHQKGLVFGDFPDFLLKLLGFSFIFGLVLFILVWGSQTLGLYRFIRSKQGKRTSGKQFWHSVYSFFGLLILFSPGYLIAYMLKPLIPSDSIILMISLGLITNGALIVYSQKFLNLMNQEMDKGYVLAARIRNVNENFENGHQSNLTWKAILGFHKHFPGHILHHILLNAKRQYWNTVRELAAFTITSLIILEMALNIQGRYGYELLRQVLYGNYGDVLAMMLGLFLIVKITEVAIDYHIYKQKLKFENGK